MKNILKNTWILLIIVLIIGFTIGKLTNSTTPKLNESTDNHLPQGEEGRGSIWTCSMHPQIRMEKPGKCPICGMELIPAEDNQQAKADPNEVSMTDEEIKTRKRNSFVGENKTR